jgi:hypothetical protein
LIGSPGFSQAIHLLLELLAATLRLGPLAAHLFNVATPPSSLSVHCRRKRHRSPLRGRRVFAAQRAQLFALDLEHAPACLLAVQVHLEREDPLLQVLLAFDRSMHPRLCFSTMLLGQLEPPRQLILQLPKLLVGKFAELFTLVDERGYPAIGLRIIGNAWMSVSRDHRTACLVILNLRCLEHIT